MPTTPSPLRYPGGKTKLYNIVKNIINTNNLHGTYIEPFAGGAGLALKLLFNGDVKRIVINDSDPAIYAFWYSVLNYTEQLCYFINNINVNIHNWKCMKKIYTNKEAYDLLTVGQATLFLNRVNVSGVIKGGVIGGIHQTGNYKMDARFNKTALINKIRDIAKYKNSILLYGLDVFDFLDSGILMHQRKGLLNFDPPYFGKGGQLYLNYFNKADHIMLKNRIARLKRKWIVTYDNCDFIEELYADYRYSLIDIIYGTSVGKKEKELMFYSKNLLVTNTYNADFSNFSNKNKTPKVNT